MICLRARAALATSGLAVLAALSFSSASAGNVTVDVGDVWYCDASLQFQVCETTIAAGDTVMWDFSSAHLPHSVTECGADCDDPSDSPLWDSEIVSGGGIYQYTLLEPGTYRYYCQVHPGQQRGRIIVTGAAETPGATSSTETPSAAETPGATAVPPTGYGPDASLSGGSWPTILTLAGTGAAMAGAGVLLARRQGGRRR